MANANPWISIAASNGGIIKLNKTGNLQIICGNAGVDKIPAGALEVTVAIGANTEIQSVSKVKKSEYAKWKVTKRQKGVNGYMKLTNTVAFNEFDLSQVILNVKGVKQSDGPNLAAGHVSYVFGKGEDGKWLAEHGNSSALDDNSLTSFTVVK